MIDKNAALATSLSDRMTAREFWAAEMPGALGLLMDADVALAGETHQAKQVARRMGMEVTGEALPVAVWHLLYRN